jgi:hypothetical protein
MMFGRSPSVGITILMLLIALGGSLAQAQEPVHWFEQLRLRTAVGQSVIVTDVQGREVHGTIADLSASALTLDVRGTRTQFLETDVERIGRRDSRWNGTLWGLGTAAVLGASLDRALVKEYGREDISVGESVAFITQTAAVGAGIGFAVDALIKGRRILYSRSASSTRSRPVVMPVWFGHRAGIFVSVAFR